VLIKKRLLMQIRDQKALFIDLIFPLLLIIVGIILATTSFYTQGGVRELDAFAYPTPLYMTRNDQSYTLHTTGSEQVIGELFTDYIYAQNTQDITNGDVVSVNGAETNFLEQIIEYDSKLYNMRQGLNQDPIPTSYGQVYIDCMADDPKKGYVYQAVLDLNATSWSVVGNFASFLYPAFLRHYLEGETLLPQ